MVGYMEGLSFRALGFRHIALLMLSHSFQGFCEGAGNPLTVLALLGETILLPCRLEPAADAVSMIVEWGRPDLKPRFVHLWHEGQSLLANQNPSYKDRTMLSPDKLKQGDLSLVLFKVKLSDSGTYRCLVPKMNRESTVELIIGSLSTPVIAEINLGGNKDVLQCESKGWYPQPQVLWLDSEGNPLSAEPTETITGSHGLFTVRSSVSVEKSNDNSFTCRVQQNYINQTRETHVHVLADINMSSSSARIAVVLLAFCVCIAAFCFALWKMHQQLKTGIMSLNKEDGCTELQDQRLTDIGYKELDQVVDASEEQKKTMDILEEQRKNLESLIHELKDQEKSMKTNIEETDKKLQAAKLAAEQDKAKGNFDFIDIILWAKEKLVERKQGDSKLLTDAQILLTKTKTLQKTLKTKMAPEEKKS